MIGMLRGQLAGPFQFFEVTFEIDRVSNTRPNWSVRMEKSEKRGAHYLLSPLNLVVGIYFSKMSITYNK